MKFKSLILLVISLFILFSCDDGIKFDNPNDKNSDAYNPSDTEAENDSGETDTISENDDETDNPSEPDNDEPISDDSDSDSTPDGADSIDDSADSEPDENNSDDDSADSVPDNDSDSTDIEPDESDSTPDEDADTTPDVEYSDNDTDTEFNDNDDVPPTYDCPIIPNGDFSSWNGNTPEDWSILNNHSYEKIDRGEGNYALRIHIDSPSSNTAAFESPRFILSANSALPTKLTFDLATNNSSKVSIWLRCGSANNNIQSYSWDDDTHYFKNTDWTVPQENYNIVDLGDTDYHKVAIIFGDEITEDFWNNHESFIQFRSGKLSDFDIKVDNFVFYSASGKCSYTPCDPNPCANIANSDGVCTEQGTTDYSCGCNSGYFWNGQKCAVLPECSATSGTPCKDSTSGLTWSEKATETMPWQDAINYCNNDTEGGFSSWHLPNIDELRTIFIADRASACQLSETNNCVSMSNCWSCETCMETGIASTSGNTCSNWGTSYSDGRYSKFGETGWFWSSSTQSASSNNAFGISFNVGGISDYARSYDHDVRCVRCEDGYFWNGSTCAVLPECSKTSGTPCKDSTSKLTWSAKAEDTMDWQTAINYCSNYIEGGLSGWHLPNIDELKTLLVWSKASSCQVSEVNDCLALDGCWTCSTCTQTGTQSSSGTGCSDWGTSYSDGRYSKFGEIGGFWSSSTRSNSTDTAWYVLFHYGGVSGGYKTNDINVRCVRK